MYAKNHQAHFIDIFSKLERVESPPTFEVSKGILLVVAPRLTARSQGPMFGGLEGTRWRELLSRLSEEDIHLLCSVWRDSTWKTSASA